MQNEVRRLLDLSPHSLSNDSPLVSPEGLGCSDVSSLESMGRPVGQALGTSLHHSNHELLKSDLYKYLTPTHPSLDYSASCVKPEDDILYQWRLRRKMEQCGHQLQSVAQPPVQSPVPPSPLYSLPPQTLSNVLSRDQSMTGLIMGTTPQTPPDTRTQEPPNTLTFPQPSLSQKQPKQHTSPCPCPRSSVLPRPLHSSPIFTPEDRRRPYRNSSTDPDMCAELPPDELSLRNSSAKRCNKPQSALHQHLPADRDRDKGGHCGVSESSKGGRAGTAQKGGGTEAEKGEKKRGERGSRHARAVEHVGRSDTAQPGGDQEGKRPKQRKDSKRRGGNEALQSTLGMVVSEVLFPDSESADASTISHITDSYEDTKSLPFQSYSAPQRPSEIIQNLLIEAEDSDGLEFEDDPLLVVLREQRAWVKQRICDMDIFLESWLEKQPL